MKTPSREPQTPTLLSALKAHFLYLCCCLNISVWFANHRTFLSFFFDILLHSAQPSWFRSAWAKVIAWLPPFFHNIFLLNLFSVLWNFFGPPWVKDFETQKLEGDISSSSVLLVLQVSYPFPEPVRKNNVRLWKGKQETKTGGKCG